MAGRVEGRVALVTGAASGIGAATARLLAEEGASVIVADRDQDNGENVARSIGNAAQFIELDVTREDQWSAVIDSVAEKFGRLDVLVNCAGIVLIADIEHTSLEQFRRVAAVNAEGIFLGCKIALPMLKRSPHASIVNIASVASHQGFGLGFAYGASKGAVRTMTKSIAAYCQESGFNIRCNSIHPNEIETPMMEDVMQRIGQPREVAEGILPPGALGAPSDVAYAALFLASTESRFITGAELTVDNGSLMRPWASSIIDPNA